ncbi:hypothetical protein [Jatrophihabitans endophyticus]|uniref:hypothetical protein n=1 Tax=Jatrophihabitans endophyticus TaxID=1206085 RepID=UPI0019DC0F64|nr:hypothetical protein [Jatrophihabitans endophyticus]MBE7190306.1 hypothetical protein [Jatrophihabitans endophyticus]
MTAAAETPPRLSPDELATLETILRKLDGPGAELPPVLFRFVTEIVATSNVDLLVRDERNRVLLSWRADGFGSGWHVPGSIIRHREEIAHRIESCAADEFGCPLAVSDRPAALIQIFDDRGHSMSLCFPARLAGTPTRPLVTERDTPEAGDLCWFDAVPDQLYPSHLVYREVIDALRDSGADPAGIPVFTQHVGERDAAQSSPDGAIAADAPLTRLD